MNKLSSGRSTIWDRLEVSSGFNALGIISADGRCRSFDADANGYMRSEGAFVFAVKPLAAAERDGDAIHAVVEATAVNTAGSADGADGLAPGRMITAPTRHAQIDLMREACSRAGLAPGDFDYVEAHATGTAVGDPIEGKRDCGSLRRRRTGSAVAGFQRQEQRWAHGNGRLPLLPAQSRPHDAPPHLRPDIQELPGAEPGNRFLELPDGGADGLRALP